MKQTNFTESFLPFVKFQEVIHPFNIVCGSNIVCTAANIQDAKKIMANFISCFPDYEYKIVDILSQK